MTMFGRDSIFTSLQALPFAPELAATTLRVLGDWQGSRRRRLPRRGPGPDPPRDALRRDGRVRGAAALAVLRLRRRHARCTSCCSTSTSAGPATGSSSATSSTRRAPRSTGSTSTPTSWATATSRTSGATSRPGLENQCWKDSWNSISYSDGRLPGFPRATCELQGYAYDAKVRGARLARLVWKDDGLRGRGSRRRPPTSSAGSTATSGSPDRRLLRARPRRGRQPGRLAGLEHRPPPVERHRRRRQGEAVVATT